MPRRLNAYLLLTAGTVGAAATLGTASCSAQTAASDAFNREAYGSDTAGAPSCGGAACQAGFHCSYDACVPDSPPVTPVRSASLDPLGAGGYVFSLETESRRLVRIDSLALDVRAFSAGLAPMDLGVVADRSLTIVLDGLDLVEVRDHRGDAEVELAYETPHALSHLVVSPSGQHSIAYYDWDDGRAQERQSEPGNINQVGVLFVGDTGVPMGEDEPRLAQITVGFLPRDVRFSRSGERAVVISRTSLTPIALGDLTSGVAVAEPPVPFDGSAAEILVDETASHAILRYPASSRVDVLDLADASVTCFVADASVTDLAFAVDGRLAVLWGDGTTQTMALVGLGDAAPTCTPLVGAFDLGAATHVAFDAASDTAIGYAPTLAVETVWKVDVAAGVVEPLLLEKAVAAVAFAGDGTTVLLSHLKKDGAPAWDPQIEDPEVSIDKSYGVTWLDAATETHRLVVSDVPFGPFTFVPASTTSEGATYQALLDIEAPGLVRVSHAAGFADRTLELAGLPLELGYLAATDRVYVTEEHPWGRVTFLDAAGETLRHVTGFALEVQ